MEKKGSIYGLIPLIVFLVIYVSTGIFTGKIDNMPLLVAFAITTGISFCLHNPQKPKLTLDEKVSMFCKGAGEETLILMVVIFLLAGAFYSVADAMGAVSSTVNLGLSILPMEMLLPGLFLTGCILSFSMGTSMGTVSALTPVAVGIANQTGISLALVCGVVVGGVVAFMQYLGGIDYLLESLHSRIRSKKGAEFGISVLVSLIVLVSTNNTVSIITAGPLAKDIADTFEIDRRRVAGLLDIFSSAFQGLMPYAGQLLVAAGMAQISPVSIMPYSWYSILMVIMGILSIMTGFPKLKK